MFLPAAHRGELANLFALATEPDAPAPWQVDTLASLVRLWLPVEPAGTATLDDPANRLLLSTATQMAVLHLHHAPETILPPPPPERLPLLQTLVALIARAVEHLREDAHDLSSGRALSVATLKAAGALAHLLDSDAQLTNLHTWALFPQWAPGQRPAPNPPETILWWGVLGQALLHALNGRWTLAAALPAVLTISAHLVAHWPESAARSPWPLRNLAAALQPLLPFAGKRPSQNFLETLTGRATLARWFHRGAADLPRVQRMRETIVAFDTDVSVDQGQTLREFSIQCDAAAWRQVLEAEVRDLQEQTGLLIPLRVPDGPDGINPQLVLASQQLVLNAGLMWNNSTSGSTYSNEDVTATYQRPPEPANPRWLFNFVSYLNDPEDRTEPDDRSDAPHHRE